MDYARKLGNQKQFSPIRNKSRISNQHQNSMTPCTEFLTEDKKLSNWKKWLEIRKKDQEKYKRILKRNENELLLNSGENYRSILETRERIEFATDPLNEAYLTKNIDLNFWITPEILSNRGNASLPDIEVPSNRKFKSFDKFVYVTSPDLILDEKGLGKPREFKSSYLEEKIKKHSDILAILDPNPPKMEKLFIQGKHLMKGRNIIRKVPVITVTSAEETERETSEWSINPDAMIAALKIENEDIVRKLNSIFVAENNRKYNWEIKFSSKINETLVKHIYFENKGNVKISFNWRSVCQSSANLPLGRRKFSSFFFNKNQGIILPGQILQFPVWFKTGKSGIVTENWRFLTDPLLSFEDITFRFFGYAEGDEETISKNKVQQVENYLNNRVRDTAIGEILEEIVNDALIFQPSPEPPYKDLFLECDIFTTKNPSYFYNSILIKQFREIYNTIFHSLDWNLSILDLRNILLKIEDSEFKQEMLSQFVNLCKAASEPIIVPSPTKDEKYGKIYNLLCSFFNCFELESETIKNIYFELCQTDADEKLAIGNVSQSRSNSLTSLDKLTPKLKAKSKKKHKRDQMAQHPNENEVKKKIKKWLISKPGDIILYEEIFYLRIYEILEEAISKACAIIDSFMRLNEPEN